MLKAGNLEPELKEPSSATSKDQLKERLANIQLITILLGVLAFLLAMGMLFLFWQTDAWQLGLVSGLLGLTSVYSVIAVRYLYPKGSINGGLVGLSLVFSIAILVLSAMLTNIGFPAGIVFLIFSLIVSSTSLTNRQANLAIVMGVVIAGASAWFTTNNLPFTNIPLPFAQVTIPMVDTITPAVLGVLFMIYVTMLTMQFVTASLRVRLVTAFMAIVIIPLGILSLFQSENMVRQLNDEIFQSLKLAASQTALGIDTFMSGSESAVSKAAQMSIFSKYLSMAPTNRAFSAEEKEMQTTLRVLDITQNNNTIYLSSFALLDEQGVNLYDTFNDRIIRKIDSDILRAAGIDMESVIQGMVQGAGHYEGDQDYFRYAIQTGVTYISPVVIQNSTKGFFYISTPVKNEKGEKIGVLRARYDGMVLQELLKQYTGLLGENSYAILLDDNYVRLADNLSPTSIYKAIAPIPDEQAVTMIASQRLPNLPKNLLWTNNQQMEKILKNYDENSPYFNAKLGLKYGDTNDQEIGAIIPTRQMPWKVIYLRSNFSNEAVTREQRNLTIQVTVAIAAVVGLIAIAISQLLSDPIFQLTKVAQQIASGDIDAQAPVNQSGEFGMLGAAFNLMTSQLRALINSLEERVKARTKEIENQNEALSTRARQLQTVSDVARQIVSSQELETLLNTITHLVSERFGFYHVGIFLLDEEKQLAVLRAANSEGGQRMLARHHSLSVGKVGIVGYATGAGQPRIATDVGTDAVYFNNPDLPNTRSEMALPLKVGQQIIGAMDIQSTESNAFHADDIELFTTLADQVAIAIYNNNLYMETLRALTESQNMHRQYLRQEWAQDTSRRKTLGYLFNQTGVRAQQAENPLWRKVFSTGEPVYAALPSTTTASESSIMAVPIAVRGETIGVIHVQDQGQERFWSEDEIAVVNSIANQVAVALENARLFENTVRRAEREKKVLQITQKIRSTNNPEEMMQIAVSELQQALRATRTQIYIRQEGGQEEPKDYPTDILEDTQVSGSTNGTSRNNGRQSKTDTDPSSGLNGGTYLGSASQHPEEQS